MQSKTWFCNKTIIHKNLTRFAPLWVSYLLCLLVGLFVIYGDSQMSPEYAGQMWRSYWFASNLMKVITVLALVNAVYAFVAVQLLFGDLYNSRTCNMLHALPLRRETWFFSNFLSGVLLSLIPLSVFTLAALPMTLGSVVENAWQLPLLLFAGGNLQYLTFFGIALFCALAVGKRFTMAAAYGLVNFGAIIAHWAITCVYTPMLYGVYLKEDWALRLTPGYDMSKSWNFFSMETSAPSLEDRFGKDLEGAVAVFSLGDGWSTLVLWALAGLALAAGALVMYRLRHLERAGDAVAFPFLKPVFLVLCSVFVSSVTYGVPRAMIGERIPTYLLLAVGLVVGWFIAKMLVEHTTKVFRLRNWYGLAVLAVAMALTLACTHFDVLNIVERKPQMKNIESVTIGRYLFDDTYGFTEQEDIEKILELHDLALEDRPEAGTYVLQDGQYVLFEEYPYITEDMEGSGPVDYRETANLCITYNLKNGLKQVRMYTIWPQEESGRIFREMTSRWEYLNNKQGQVVMPDGTQMESLDFVLKYFYAINADTGEFRQENNSRQFTLADAQQLLEAIRADCAEGTMSQNSIYHTGYFRWPNPYSDDGVSRRSGIYLALSGRIGEDYRYAANWQIQVYPDSRHTLAWMEAAGLLEGVEVFHIKQPLW